MQPAQILGGIGRAQRDHGHEQGKQAGAALLQQKKYPEAAAEYRSALASMSELLQKLPDDEASPIAQQIIKLRRGMEAELVKAQKGMIASGDI